MALQTENYKHRISIMIRPAFQLLHSTLTFFCQAFPDTIWGNKIRGNIWKLVLKTCGENLQVCKNVEILAPSKISLGDNVFISHGTWINGYGTLSIEDDVMIGPQCAISTANHSRDKTGSFRNGDHILNGVVIYKGAWVGANVSVLPGTKIGKNTVIGAGAVVRGVLDDNALYVGPIAKKKS